MFRVASSVGGNGIWLVRSKARNLARHNPIPGSNCQIEFRFTSMTDLLRGRSTNRQMDTASLRSGIPKAKLSKGLFKSSRKGPFFLLVRSDLDLHKYCRKVLQQRRG